VLQFNKHAVLAVALLVVVAEAVGAAPGTTQVVRQFAAAELQIIMQFVTVDVCASLILPWAEAPCAAKLIAAQTRIAKPRMIPPPARTRVEGIIPRRRGKIARLS
jgi:hypothetical protein